MIAITYEQLFLISIAVYAVYEIITLIKAKKINYLREIFKGLFFIYFQAVLYFTFYPLNIFYYLENNFYINYIPIVETLSMLQINLRIGLHNIIGNILMFVPLGMFIPFLFKKRDKFWYVFSCGFLGSLFIEVNQLFLGDRATDIDDVIFNTLGTVIGYILFKFIFKFIGKIKLVDKIYKRINNNSKSVITCGLAILVPIFLILHTFIMVNKHHFIKTNSKTNEKIIEAYNDIPNTKLISSKKLNEKEYIFY